MDKEYKAHAKSLDRRYNNTQINEKGPVERELEKYASVIGFGIGSFGECSKEVYASGLHLLANMRHLN